MTKQFFVYITASKRNGTLYVGVTSDLPGRAWQHKNKVIDGFTAKYDVDQLVYFEPHDRAETAYFESGKSRNGGGSGRFG